MQRARLRTTSTPTTGKPSRIFPLARGSPQSRRVAVASASSAAPLTVAVTVQQAGEPDVVLQIESDSQLRAAMIANKVDLYTTWGKVANCGGGGTCGTCIVDIRAASDECLTERSPAEEKKLRGKPATWRLACQTFVGDGVTPGQTVTIATKPTK
jgi:ferredoxin